MSFSKVVQCILIIVVWSSPSKVGNAYGYIPFVNTNAFWCVTDNTYSYDWLVYFCSGRKEDIHSILTKVNRIVSSKILQGCKQMPEVRYTVTKTLVLPMKQGSWLAAGDNLASIHPFLPFGKSAFCNAFRILILKCMYCWQLAVEIGTAV